MDTQYSTDNKKKEKNSGSEPLTDWMIERIRNRCLIIILSLLEMRDVKTDGDLIRIIMRYMPIKLIEKYIVKVYKSQEKFYKKHYL
jgi:hypothetical protein